MKELIRQVLIEESKESGLKKYVLTVFKRQVDSGLIPHIPYEDFRRKKLTKHIELIDIWYTQFLESHYGVGGYEKAKTLFGKSLENINQDDLKKSGISTGQDQFDVEITYIEFSNQDSTVDFGFKINDCYLETEDGMKTYEELLSNDFPDEWWNDVTDYLKGQIEEYVIIKALEFGLNVLRVYSNWDD